MTAGTGSLLLVFLDEIAHEIFQGIFDFLGVRGNYSCGIITGKLFGQEKFVYLDIKKIGKLKEVLRPYKFFAGFNIMDGVFGNAHFLCQSLLAPSHNAPVQPDIFAKEQMEIPGCCPGR